MSNVSRIALVHLGDPTSPRSWSGTPVGITSGLRQAGSDVVPVDAGPPAAGAIAHRLGMSWADQAASPVFAATSGAIGSLRLVRAGRLDGVIAIGSGFKLLGRQPTVTFEDMTVSQALERGDPVYASLSGRATRRWRQRQQHIYEQNRACCVASTWAATSVREDYGIPADKVHVVGFGRNVDAGWIERDWKVPHFLWVGADWTRKRGEATVRAFAAVREQHPEATLDLVGDHPSIQVDGVTGHGRLALGSNSGREQYAALIRRATCFIMPSTYEPFGIAYLDAGATGLPSIGTTVGGAIDAIGDGGILVDPAEPDALTAAMLSLCDSDTARELGEQAMKRADLFTWQAVAERMLRALRPAGLPLDGLAQFLDQADRGAGSG